MHPVLAHEFFLVKDMDRRQRLAEAERHRLIESAAPAAGARRRPATALCRLRVGLAGAVATAFPFRGVRRVPLSAE